MLPVGEFLSTTGVVGWGRLSTQDLEAFAELLKLGLQSGQLFYYGECLCGSRGHAVTEAHHCVISSACISAAAVLRFLSEESTCHVAECETEVQVCGNKVNPATIRQFLKRSSVRHD